MRIRDGLIKHPMLRVDLAEQSERHATWLELFYDLAYVAVVGALATALKESTGSDVLAKFWLLLVPVWWSWVGHTFYLSRFDSDDLIHRCLGLLQIIGAVSIAIQIPAALEGQTAGFSVAYCAVRLLLVAQYLYAAVKNPKARVLAIRWAGGFLVGAAIWGLSSGLTAPVVYLGWGAAIAVDLLTPFLNRTLPIKIPVNYRHISERLGLFTIIVLGETILASASGVRFQDLGFSSGSALVLGLILAFVTWWVYFEGVKGHEVSPPTQPKDIRKMQFWLYAHLPLAGGIVLTAVGIKKVMALDLLEPIPDAVARIFAFGIVLVAVSLQAIWYAGLKPAYHRFAFQLSLPHSLATCALCVGALASPYMSSIAWLGLMIALFSVHMVMDVFGESQVERIARLDPHEPMAQPF